MFIIAGGPQNQLTLSFNSNFIKLWGRVTSLDLLSKYLLIIEFRFDAMLYSTLGNKIFDAGHIKRSRGPYLAQVPQVPIPGLDRPSSCSFVLFHHSCHFRWGSNVLLVYFIQMHYSMYHSELGNAFSRKQRKQQVLTSSLPVSARCKLNSFRMYLLGRYYTCLPFCFSYRFSMNGFNGQEMRMLPDNSAFSFNSRFGRPFYSPAELSPDSFAEQLRHNDSASMVVCRSQMGKNAASSMSIGKFFQRLWVPNIAAFLLNGRNWALVIKMCRCETRIYIYIYIYMFA